MDIFLRFKNKKHAEAYACDLEYQVQTRLVMLSIGMSVSITVYTIMSVFNPNLGNKASQLLVAVRFSLTLVALLGYYLLKKYMHQVQPYASKLVILLDIVCLVGQFVIYPISGNIAVDNFSKLGVYVWAWCAAFGAFSVYFILTNWWLKMLNIVLQMAFFLYFVVKREPIFTPILNLCFIAVFSFVFLSYTQEMYQKKDFLEKRKLYDNYEALKRIFDDISQGIVIVDTEFKTIYANRTIASMLNRHSPQKAVVIEELFSEIQVRAISPALMSTTSERITLSKQKAQVARLIQWNFINIWLI